MSNKRRHARLPLRLSAAIHLTDGSTYQGTTENTSFSGLLLKCKNPDILEKGDPCDVELLLDSKTTLKVRFECIVIRVEKNRIALQFSAHDDKDYFEHYKNLMLLNSPDPEAFLREINENKPSES
ncbi:MAG TPA: PilZ domain-containing protein [Spirochaetota bacterium]|nr:PilZ domain-containing protein [Spirochaetota bacterium]